MAGQSIRVALAGVGNCASALIQGLSYYADRPDAPGLARPYIADYGIGAIKVVAAFDVHARKVGVDLADAIAVAPNNTLRFAELATTGVVVSRGPTLDGIGVYVSDDFQESPEAPVDVAAALRAARAEVFVSYLPVGSQQASEFYASEALKAGCAYVNCIPVFLASDPLWRGRFEAARLPIVGDDIKSQIGATVVHRLLAALFAERGARLDHTYQLNFGGNADFLNMLERERLASKRLSKTRSVASQLGSPLPARDIHIGPSDFVPWLDDRKFAHIRLEGLGFGGAPINIDLKLDVWDSPNSAGVVVDAIRCAKLALDRRIGGALAGPSGSFMKSPPTQYSEAEAAALTERFIAGA